MALEVMQPTEASELRPFFQSAPLYEAFPLVVRGPIGDGPFTQDQLDTQRIYLPRDISLFCDHPKCERVMEWDLYNAGSTQHGEATGVRLQLTSTFQQLRYTCRHCAQRSVVFFLQFRIVKRPSWTVEKVGRAPRADPVLSRELLAGLGTEGQALYRKAVESRGQGMGLGALAYLRRVVEDAMNSLLDLLGTAVIGADREEDLLAAIVSAKAEKVFTKKVGFAKAVLPARFFHGGHNPLERLHDWASAGIHNRDDWECLEIFDEIATLFELLFERLAREAADRKLYEEKLMSLTRKK